MYYNIESVYLFITFNIKNEELNYYTFINNSLSLFKIHEFMNHSNACELT